MEYQIKKSKKDIIKSIIDAINTVNIFEEGNWENKIKNIIKNNKLLNSDIDIIINSIIDCSDCYSCQKPLCKDILNSLKS